MTRVALYARYSSDRQSERSIEDQLAVSRDRARLEGWTVTQTFEDRALPGASMFGRSGLLDLMEAAKRRQFDIVLSEHLDRISRDQEDIAAVHKRLSFAGVRIFTLAQGFVSEIHVGLNGTMAALFLKDLADKTRRGLRGRVRQGQSGGGLSYGYRTSRTEDGVAGGREIKEDEANVVRRIYRDYAAGVAPIAIARKLNQEGVCGPRGAIWAQTTIIGQKARETGLLRNRLYIGEMVWGKTTWVKDPETGRRRSRAGEPTQIETVAVPNLRIVDDELWSAVQLRLKVQSKVRLHARTRPTHLLTGLLACGVCGGPYTVQDRGLCGCARRKAGVGCDNGRRIAREEIERRVLDALAHELMRPDLVAEYIREYQAAYKRETQARRADQQTMERRAGELERKVKRLVGKIADGEAEGSAGKAVMQELNAAAEELDSVKAVLAASTAEEQAVALHPNLADRLAGQLQEFRSALEGDSPDMAKAREALRRVIDKVTVSPAPNTDADGRGCGPVALRVEGKLAALLNLSKRPDYRVDVGCGDRI